MAAATSLPIQHRSGLVIAVVDCSGHVKRQRNDPLGRGGVGLGVAELKVQIVNQTFEHAFGNAILTRWPVDRIASEALPNASGEPGHRCIVAGIVDTPSGRWPIASTHFDHRFDASATRQQQATRLLELGVVWRGDPDNSLPLIVGADVNAVADTDEIRTLTGRRAGVAGIVFSDVWDHVGDGNGYTWRAANPYSDESTWPNRRLDYLLVSWPRPKPVGNPIRAWNVGTEPVDIDGEATWPSDHAAVVADFVTPI
jgi:endonuclease/exonuclease/phosphatase family metal-dependent hydrolase